MDIATYKNDVWGQEVLRGVSWDLLWLVVVLAFIAIAAHAIYEASQSRGDRPTSEGERVNRHDAIDRAFHWIMAGSVFVLLATGVFPIIGLEFVWLEIHWIAGIVLTIVVAFHIVRSFTQDLGSMAVGPGDRKEALDGKTKPGKYSPAQKSMHAIATILTLVVIVTGLIMFLQIDTPWWERTNEMSESALGWLFFLHGLSTLGLIAVICLHIYFAIRPEKLFYMRSMIKGWISKEDLVAHHDPQRWPPDKSN